MTSCVCVGYRVCLYDVAANRQDFLRRRVDLISNQIDSIRENANMFVDEWSVSESSKLIGSSLERIACEAVFFFFFFVSE
jgi:hypothetical protein